VNYDLIGVVNWDYECGKLGIKVESIGN